MARIADRDEAEISQFGIGSIRTDGEMVGNAGNVDLFSLSVVGNGVPGIAQRLKNIFVQPVAALDLISSGSSNDGVSSRIAPKLVVTQTTKDDIVSAVAADHVPTSPADYRVVPIIAGHGL